MERGYVPPFWLPTLPGSVSTNHAQPDRDAVEGRLQWAVHQSRFYQRTRTSRTGDSQAADVHRWVLFVPGETSVVLLSSFN